MLDNSVKNKILISVIAIFIDGWSRVFVYGTFLLSLHINLATLDTFRTAVKLIVCRTNSTNFRCKQMELKEFRQIYHQLSILIIIYNNVFGKEHVPVVKTALGAIAVVCVFMSVRLSSLSFAGIFGLAMVPVSIASLAIFTLFNSMVYESSNAFRMFLRAKEYKTKQAQTMVSSMKLVAVRSGNFYEIRRESCLVTLDIVANICATVLIAFSM